MQEIKETNDVKASENVNQALQNTSITKTTTPTIQKQNTIPSNTKSKDSNVPAESPEVIELRDIINKFREQRSELIKQIRGNKYRLYYKETEKIAVAKLIEENPDEIDYKRIRYFKKLKNRIEFKISTSSLTLNEEKDLIRKINQVNEELAKSMKFVRLKRKSELINSDIEEFKSNINQLDDEISAIDLKLDDYFSKLRAINRSNNKFERFNRSNNVNNRKYEPRPTPNFSIEDIVIIKKHKTGSKK